jgi:hypothetical protein
MAAKVKIVTAYAVHRDDSDVRQGEPAYFFNTEATANRFATGRGWYGGKAPVTKQYLLYVPAANSPSGKVEHYFIGNRSHPVRLCATTEDGELALDEQIGNDLRTSIERKLSTEELDYLRRNKL